MCILLLGRRGFNASKANCNKGCGCGHVSHTGEIKVGFVVPGKVSSIKLPLKLRVRASLVMKRVLASSC